MLLLFKCGYCGKEFTTLSERCNCETRCGKKREEETRRKEQERLAGEKKNKDEDITKAFDCLIKQIDKYHLDYNEKCSIEHQPRSELISNHLRIRDLMRDLWAL